MGAVIGIVGGIIALVVIIVVVIVCCRSCNNSSSGSSGSSGSSSSVAPLQSSQPIVVFPTQRAFSGQTVAQNLVNSLPPQPPAEYQYKNPNFTEIQTFDDYTTGYYRLVLAKGWYEGYLANGKFEGEGRFVLNDGSYYQGSFRNDKFNGYGVYQDCSGLRYEGQFYEGLMTGQGRMWHSRQSRAENLSYYSEGMFKEGSRHGFAKKMFVDGEVWEGEWAEDMPNGNFTMLFPDGDRYAGTRYSSVRDDQSYSSGVGVMTKPDGTAYRCTLQRNANGTHTFVRM